MNDLQGHIRDDAFEPMATILSESIDSGDDCGASVCVTVGGETVLDIWGGHCDEAGTTS